MDEQVRQSCERCGGAPVSAYRKTVPRMIHLCQPCWNKLGWARVERKSLWDSSPDGFLGGFIASKIHVYPDDPHFRVCAALRALSRLRAKRVEHRTAITRSFGARQDDVTLAAEILGETVGELKNLVLVHEVLQEARKGIDAIEGRMASLLLHHPVYTRYLLNVEKDIRGSDAGVEERLAAKGAKGTPGVVVFGGIMGEIGAARELLCFEHKRTELLRTCGHAREMGMDEALLLSRPKQRAYGIEAFPSSSDLCAFFGLGLRRSGSQLAKSENETEEWWFRDKPAKGEELRVSLRRKTLVVQYLASAFEKTPKDGSNPWCDFYREEKVRKLEQWRTWFAKTPPPKCAACLTGQCQKCPDCSGNWVRPKDPEAALWVCQCHGSGYWFGSPGHVRMHALGKTGSLFLALLWHVWRYIERLGPAPYNPLVTVYLTK